jgi:hypothetical protein
MTHPITAETLTAREGDKFRIGRNVQIKVILRRIHSACRRSRSGPNVR